MSEKSRTNPHVPNCTLYHATLHVNTFLVKHEGIKVKLDRRGKSRIWLTEYRHLEHVVNHLTASRGMSVAHWSIFEVHSWKLPSWPRSCGRAGIFYVDQDISRDHIQLLETRWIGFEPHELADDDNHVYTYSEELRTFVPRSAC